MEQKKNSNYIGYIAISFSIFVLMVVRIFLKENDNWIEFINIAGLMIAFIDLYNNTKHSYSDAKNIDFCTGLFIIIICVLIVFEVTVLLEIININEKVSDLIMLLTIFISLPKPLYVRIIGKKIK